MCVNNAEPIDKCVIWHLREFHGRALVSEEEEEESSESNIESKLCETFLSLGEAGLKSKDNSQAMEDLTACYSKPLEKHPVDSCSIAEICYRHGVALSFRCPMEDMLKEGIGTGVARITFVVDPAPAIHSAWVCAFCGLDGVTKKQRCEAGRLGRKNFPPGSARDRLREGRWLCRTRRGRPRRPRGGAGARRGRGDPQGCGQSRAGDEGHGRVECICRDGRELGRQDHCVARGGFGEVLALGVVDIFDDDRWLHWRS